jgi:hypothetical protein
MFVNVIGSVAATLLLLLSSHTTIHGLGNGAAVKPEMGESGVLPRGIHKALPRYRR